MPGVIGASIFSPRPARGYRFHSLQVEIISCSYSPERRNHFQYSVRRRRFVPRSEHLTTKIVPRNQPVANWPGGHRPGRQATPPQITANLPVQSRSAWPDLGSSSHHERATATLQQITIACGKRRLGGRSAAFKKIKREVTPCKIKLR